MKITDKKGGKSMLSPLGEFFEEMFFPSSCYKCKKIGTYLCESCYPDLNILQEPTCPDCNIRLPFGVTLKTCKQILKLDRIFTPAYYKDETLNKIIKDFKYNHAYKLAVPLGDFVYWWLSKQKYTDEIKNNIDLIIAVPSHRKKLKKRGFNPAELLASQLSTSMKIASGKNILIKEKNTLPQIQMENAGSRKENLKNAFVVPTANKSILKGKNILLVDDVITTSSTLRECSKRLKKSGAKEVWGLAIARD